jgi:hypothetical protein
MAGKSITGPGIPEPHDKTQGELLLLGLLALGDDFHLSDFLFCPLFFLDGAGTTDGDDNGIVLGIDVSAFGEGELRKEDRLVEVETGDVNDNRIGDLRRKNIHDHFVKMKFDNAAGLGTDAGFAADKFDGNIHRNLMPLDKLVEVDVQQVAGERITGHILHDGHFLFPIGKGKLEDGRLPVAALEDGSKFQQGHPDSLAFFVARTIEDSRDLAFCPKLTASAFTGFVPLLKSDFGQFFHQSCTSKTDSDKVRRIFLQRNRMLTE